MFIFLFLIFSQAWSQETAPEIKYAPTIYQGLGTVPEADEFTRVDFDQDWNPDNNWDHTLKYPRPRVVYFDVMESERHYFITYAFFFPRDYSQFCFWVHCHENDFEGMRVTVKKSGEVLKLEGLAHNTRSEVLSPEKIEVYIEDSGHGVHPRSLKKDIGEVKIYRPQDYELRPLKEIWEKRGTSLFTGEFTYKGKSYPANFGGKKWILFGLGAAKPSWSWIIFNSEFEKGQWFLDPLKGSSERYIKHLTDDASYGID